MAILYVSFGDVSVPRVWQVDARPEAVGQSANRLGPRGLGHAADPHVRLNRQRDQTLMAPAPAMPPAVTPAVMPAMPPAVTPTVQPVVPPAVTPAVQPSRCATAVATTASSRPLPLIPRTSHLSPLTSNRYGVFP